MSQIKVDSIVPRAGLPAGANGGIIQVVQTIKTDTLSTTGANAAEADITGMSCNITLSHSSNKVLAICSTCFSATSSTYIVLYRGATRIGAGDAATDKLQVMYGGYPGSSGVGGADGPMAYGSWAHTHTILDTPGSGTHTYKLRWVSESNNTKRLNTGYGNADHSGRGVSTITLMEVTT
jgi:hypothetical protein